MRWMQGFRQVLLLAALVAPALRAQAPTGPTGRIVGTVSDSAAAQPLANATVSVVGTRVGAQSGTDGRYSIGGVPAGEQQVRVQRLGYAPIVVNIIVPAGGSVTLDARLRAQAVLLTEVVSVGYGTQSRRDVAGAISTVTTEALEKAPVSSIDQVLQGTSPGVQVTTASSEPGGALSVRIRGTSSLTGNSEPLYVVDGFPIENDLEGSSVGNGGRDRTTPTNPLVTLNPSDIESISILKDASATAIYGARGANGVVIITTKQGRGTRPQFSLDFYTGAQQVAKTYEMLNAAEYMDFANTFAKNASTPYEPFPAAVKDSILRAGTNTDWQDEIFRTGAVRNLQLSVRGATTASSPTRYSMSGGVFDQEGIVLGSGLKRLSGRINLNQSVGSRIEFGGSLTASQARSRSVPSGGQQNTNAGAISAAIQYVPILPVKRADGSYSYINSDLNAFASLLDAPQTPNPVSLAREVSDSLSDTRFLGNIFATAEIFDGLEAKVSFGGDYADRWRYTYYPRTTLRGSQTNGYAIRASSATTSWLNENTLTYARRFGTAHDLNVLGGYTRQRTDLDGDNMSNTQFVSDITGYYDIGAGTQEGGPSISSRHTSQTLESWLGRVNYTLLDRYIFTATYRTDGSSRFSANHKWGSFPSAAAAWRVSSEPWFQSLAGSIEDLKLRASVGTVGNPSIRPYQSLSRLSDQGYSFGGSPYAGYYPAAVGNPDLTWESTRQIDYGIDVAFLKRFNLVADYYEKRTTDLLLLIRLPLESGFQSALANRGEVRNRGIEIGLDAQILRGGSNGVSWRANANFATNKNEIMDLGGPDRIEAQFITTDYNLPGTLFQVGKPLGVFYGFKSRGVIPDSATAASITHRPFTGTRFDAGDMWIEDVDGDGVITLADRTDIGNPFPDFTYGFTNTVSWKGLELTGLLQGQQGGKVLNVNRIRTESSPRVNISRERYYDAWSPENPNAKFPALGDNPNQVGTNNFTSNLLEDASYLRLRTLTLSYGIPQRLLRSSRVANARMYVTGTNLFTISDYSGFDPDVSSQSVGSQNRGIDIGAYPLARGVTVGLNFTY